MKKILTFLPLLFLGLAIQAQNVITITDNDLQGNATHNWTANNVYLLDGFVFLEASGVLNIEAGTVIKGKEIPSNSDNASALIITRDAQINAVGTAQQPIIFTAEIDDVNDATDLFADDRGLWGGLIILGNATLANTTAETRVEGIPDGEDRAIFGGTNDEDNSGTLKYVSIRHGGAELSPGNEINGLTLGGVGSGTSIEYVEVIANEDDGIEFFGGTVSVKYATVSFAGDDSFDWDLGWRGNGQYWFALVGDDIGDNGGELDGAKPDDGEPTSNPTITNATFIGAGCGTTSSNATAVLFRDGGAGKFYNSIFTGFNDGIEVEDRASGVDSRQRMENGDLVLANNIWFDFCNGNELNAGANGLIRSTDDAEDANAQFLIDHLTTNNNSLDNPNFNSIARIEGGNLDPRPEFGGAAYQNLAATPADAFFQNASHKGAFGSSLWLHDWTALSAYGFLPEPTEGVCTETVIITDGDLVGGQTYNWTSDKCYQLDGFVFLEAGGVLNIEAGTVIKGKEIPSTSDNASALIIARDAQINAIGTAQQPIIFTAEIDDLEDDFDLAVTDRGLWGGLIVLGNAVLANTTPETRVEGIPDGEDRAIFGGTDDADNSGILQYISIRHGGAELSPGNEINGLTLGGVGSGTLIENIEVLANDDDGIEFFGGTVNLKYAAVAFCGDDAFDWDLGWRGNGQFWLALTGDDLGDNSGELDGAKPDDGEPTSNPTIYNGTFIGAGCGTPASNATGLLFRDGSAGTLANSVITEQNFGIEVEDRASGVDSRQRMENGDLVISNNVWGNFCNGNELNTGANGFLRATDDAEDATAQFLIDHLVANKNIIQDPQFVISRIEDGSFNPVGADLTTTKANHIDNYPTDAFFTPVCFLGAFGENAVWIQNWTALATYGVLNPDLAFGIPAASTSCGTTSTEEIEIFDKGYSLIQNTPNPTTNTTQIGFTLSTKKNINLTIYDYTGKVVSTLIDNVAYPVGLNTVELDVSNFANGVYFYTLSNDEIVLTKQLVVLK